MVSAYQPGHHSHLYSARQAQQRLIFHTMNNVHQAKIMSTPPQTVSINAPPHTMNKRTATYLDRLHNRSLRLITGQLVSTPLEALRLEADVQSY